MGTEETQGKVRALLAGGLVLGVGATVTLAGWNDSESARTTFEAGSFNLVGSTDGTSFADHPASSPATLAFTVEPDNLAPGDTVYAPYAVQLDAPTTHDAVVTVSAGPADGVLEGLTYQVIRTEEFGCGTAAVGEPLVDPGTPVAAAPEDATFSLTSGKATAPGDPANLCFQVTAGDIAQGQTGSVTWTLAAESL